MEQPQLIAILRKQSFSPAIIEKMVEDVKEYPFYQFNLKTRMKHGLSGVYAALAFGHNHELFEREYNYQEYTHSALSDAFNEVIQGFKV